MLPFFRLYEIYIHKVTAVFKILLYTEVYYRTTTAPKQWPFPVLNDFNLIFQSLSHYKKKKVTVLTHKLHITSSPTAFITQLGLIYGPIECSNWVLWRDIFLPTLEDAQTVSEPWTLSLFHIILLCNTPEILLVIEHRATKWKHQDHHS